MNKILNGDFRSGFDHWDNGASGGFSYVLDIERAKASSYQDSGNEKIYKMLQTVALNDEILTAKITVWGRWESQSGDEQDGYNRFIVELKKPGGSIVTLYDQTKTATIGQGNLLDEYDIKSDLDEYGNYELWLTVKTASAGEIQEEPFPILWHMSNAWYDNINVDIAVKKYKTVHEVLGSSGKLGGKASVLRSEIVGLVEAYSTETFSPTFNYETSSESVGLNESYSTILKRVHGEVEAVGLVEAIQAKRTQGNVETTYVLEDLTQWTEISQVTTPWIKEKTEIN